MKHSRRGMIIDMLEAKKSDTEILRVLDREFPPGHFKSTNEQALAGTKWDIGHTSSTEKKPKPIQNVPRKTHHARQVPTFQRIELIRKLKEFNSEPVIQRYKQNDLHGKSPNQLVAFTMGTSIYRAFRYETPSERYRNWRWYDKGPLILSNLNSLDSQEAFDRMAISLGKSLVADWGAKNERGEPSRMNIGIAMKIINLLLKHLSCSEHCHNKALFPLLHVPWDSFTLLPLCYIWSGNPPIPESPSQGFVKNLETYQGLHRMITDITKEAGVPRITYEFWAWDATH